MPTNYTINGLTLKTSRQAVIGGDNAAAVYTAVARAEAKYKIAVSAAAEDSNSITVTATVTTTDGTAVGHVPILFRTLAVTDDKADITDGGTGAVVKAYSPAAGVNEAWFTSVSGVAQAAIANTVAEAVLVQVMSGDAVYTTTVTFA